MIYITFRLHSFTYRIVQPIPLECLRLASFDDEPEEVRQAQQPRPGLFRGMLSCCSSLPPEPMYPFTIYHAAAKITRRHTLYTLTATERNRWRTALDDAIEARKSKHEKTVLLLRFDFSTRLIIERSYTQPKRSMMAASSGYLHVYSLFVG
jgi:hypothetical protein